MVDPKNKSVYYVPAGSPVYPDRFDTRIRLRSLTRGLLTPDELSKHLASLADESANAEVVDYSKQSDADIDASLD